MLRKIKYGCLLMLLLCNATMYAQQQVKAMSYNIRLDVESDGENRWDARKDKVAALMNYYGADFIGCQEVQHHQLLYLLSALKQYRYIGVGRDDGKEAGEYSCIFYDSTKYKLIRQSTFWLSATPDSVSMGWDAACHRVCSYGLFRSVATSKLLWVFNTHFDHRGEKAREESAKLIVQKIKALNTGKNYPVILTGDFNSKPQDIPAKYISEHMLNSRSVCETDPYGPADTWNGFEFSKTPDGCIDYIFLSNNKKWKVKKFATITDSYNRKYPSDHFPVMATLELLNKR